MLNRFIWPCTLAFGALASPAFGDPREIFLQYVTRLVELDPELKEQQANLQARYANITADASRGLPDLGLQMSKTWLDQSSGDTLQSTNFDLQARVNVYAFGRDGLHWKLADAKQLIMDLESEALKLEAERRAASLLIDAIGSRKRLELTQRIVAIRKRFNDMAAARCSRGLLSELDCQKTTIDMEMAEISVLEQQTESSSRQSVLTQRLGVMPTDLQFPVDDVALSFDKVLDAFPEKSDQPSLNERIAASTVEMGSLAKEISYREFFPSLDLSVSKSIYRSEPPDDGRQETLVALSLSIPLLDQGSRRSDNVRAVSEWTAAQSQLAGRRRTFSENNESLHKKLRILASTTRTRKRLLDTSRRIHENSLKRFAAASVSVNEVNMEEERLLVKEAEFVSVLIDMNNTVVEHCALRGVHLKNCLD